MLTSRQPDPFVGREAELESLRDELAIVCAGTPRLVLIEGSPGIGKSSMIDHFLDDLTDVERVEVGPGVVLERVTPRRQHRRHGSTLRGQPRHGGGPRQVDRDRDDAHAVEGTGHATGTAASTSVPVAARSVSQADGRNRSP